MSKRSLVVLLLTTLLLGLLTACGGQGAATPSPAADKSKLGDTLNIFNWSEYLPEDVLKDFENAYGVKVNYDTYSSNEEMAAKLQAGAGKYDLVVPTTYMVTSLGKQGLLSQLDLSLLPNLKNIDAQYKNQKFDPNNHYSVPYMWGTVGIAYNSKYVKTPPKKWADLLDPAYKGKIVAVDDSREILMVGLQATGSDRNETDPAKLKAAEDWLKKLVPAIKAWDSDNPKQMLIGEEAWIGIVFNGEAALAMKENKDIRYAMPAEGGGLWLDSLAIPKGAPHAYAAHVFINYILQPDIAARIGEAYPYGLPNTAGYKLLTKETKENQASYPPQEWLTKATNPADLGDAAATFDRIFTEVKAR